MRFSYRTIVSARKPASFWRDKRDTVVFCKNVVVSKQVNNTVSRVWNVTNHIKPPISSPPYQAPHIKPPTISSPPYQAPHIKPPTISSPPFQAPHETTSQAPTYHIKPLIFYHQYDFMTHHIRPRPTISSP